MCEVVNPVLQQPSTGTPLPQQSPSTLPQQIPFMFVMATGNGNYGQTTTNTNYSSNNNCSPPIAIVTTSPATCNNFTATMSLQNANFYQQQQQHHPLTYGAHCPTPPPVQSTMTMPTIPVASAAVSSPPQPATTTIYTLHTIGASTNYIQLQPTQTTPIQNISQTPISISNIQQDNNGLDYYSSSVPSIPLSATPTYHIEVPAHTLRIELGPFKSASELCAEPGDIIEIDRTLFSHWAIYIGSGEVVHIVGSETQEVPDNERAIVQKLPLIQVAGDCPCRVNNKTLRARERNFLPFHNEIVVRKALSKVGSTVPYNTLTCNSEHYVTEWKYGHRWSDQAQFNLNSFKALRRPHANSVTESHQLFVNTLNEVLNSPANSGSCLSNLNSSSPSSSSTSTLQSNHHPIIHNSLSTSPPRRTRQMSVSEQSTTSSPTPPSAGNGTTSGNGPITKGKNAFQARLTRAMSASTFSTAVQTELSLL